MTQPRDLPVLALIYDRHATPDRAALDARLAACREYAAGRKWETADEPWIDEGLHALSDERRPAFDRLMIRLAEVAVTGRAVVVLVHDRERLSRAGSKQDHMRHRVALAGGWTETAGGETDLLTGPRRWAMTSRLGS